VENEKYERKEVEKEKEKEKKGWRRNGPRRRRSWAESR
jgi:hypothetical protein